MYLLKEKSKHQTGIIMKKTIFLTFLFILMICPKQSSAQKTPIEKYNQLSESITTGWNTWDNRSILSHVLLPEGLAFQLIIEDTLNNKQLPIAFTGNHVADTEKVRTLAHAPDGAYTDCYLQWQDFGMQVQSVTFGDDELLIKITPDRDFGNPGFIQVDGKMLYGGIGEIKESGTSITAKLPTRTIGLK